MKEKIFITCAVTGAGNSTQRSPHVPVTPEQIATAALDAAAAGAAVVHLHVRDVETGQGCRDPKLFAETVERIRAVNTDVLINLTAGMGGDLVLSSGEHPLPPNPEGTDMAGAKERLRHVEELLPDICTLDCGSMNFAAGGDYIMINTPSILYQMAAQVRALGVRPELEVFDSGQLVFVREMVRDNKLESPFLIQLCMGIPYGAPAQLDLLMNMVHRLPPKTVWSSFSIGRLQMPWLAATAFAGGNVRVGLEDNLWLERNVPATNAQLVERAVTLLTQMGIGIMTAAETRQLLALPKRH